MMAQKNHEKPIPSDSSADWGTFRFFGLFRFGFLHQQCLLYLFGWARPERQHRIEAPILRSRGDGRSFPGIHGSATRQRGFP